MPAEAQNQAAFGQVSLGVIKQLRQAMPVDVFRELLPPEAFNPQHPEPLMKNIPSKWTRNVQENNRRRRPWQDRRT